MPQPPPTFNSWSANEPSNRRELRFGGRKHEDVKHEDMIHVLFHGAGCSGSFPSNTANTSRTTQLMFSNAV
jgi:hypothetical protein